MAYNDHSEHGFSANTPAITNMVLKANGLNVQLPDASYIREAELKRDSSDLILETAKGKITIQDYFSVIEKPVLSAPDGSILSPKLVNAFVKSGQEYANIGSMTDESPVGSIAEITGDATITRVDGSVETVTIGTEVYNGDIVETSDQGAINITFIDESSFAVSEGARLSIDEYVFDPSTESGQTDFSVLKGMFVYTSGLIGRDDPDDVTIDTPVGSIGIRGTIIAGDVDQGEITVVEGAIVLRDFDGNEVTLANQFETARFDLDGKGIDHLGELSAGDVVGKFASISNVSPSLFSSIEDSAAENSEKDAAETEESQEAEETKSEEDTNESEAEAETKNAEADENQNSENEAEQTAEETEANETEQQANDTNNPEPTAEQSEPAPAPEPGLQTPLQTANTITLGSPLAEATAPQIRTVGNRILQPNSEPQEPIRTLQTTNDLAPIIQDTTIETNNLKPIILDNEIAFGFTLKEGSETQPTKIFHFFFDQLFNDPEGDNLTFHLSEESIKNLRDVTEGSGTGDILDTTEFNGVEQVDILPSGNGFRFDPTNGRLTLFLNEATEFGGGVDDINLEVFARDSAGHHSDFIDVTFTAYDTTLVNSATTINVANSSDVIQSVAADVFMTITGASIGATVFLKDGAFVGDLAETINLNNVVDITLYAGEGNKKVNILSGSYDNTIYGGNDFRSNDAFSIANTDNDIFGMNGSDNFKVNLDVATVDLTSSSRTFDGGSNAKTIAEFIASGTPAVGDTLELFNNNGGQEVIDFSAITTNLQNFEHLELSGVGGVKVILSLNDVISMTDDNNALVISGDGNDAIQWSAEEFQTNGETQTIDGDLYQIYSGNLDGAQNVTLYVEASITDVSAVG